MVYLVAFEGVEDGDKDLAHVIGRLLLRDNALVVRIEDVDTQTHHLVFGEGRWVGGWMVGLIG